MSNAVDGAEAEEAIPEWLREREALLKKFECFRPSKFYTREDLDKLSEAGGVTIGERDILALDRIALQWFDDSIFQNAADGRKYAQTRKLVEQVQGLIEETPLSIDWSRPLRRLRSELLFCEGALKPGKGRPEDGVLVAKLFFVIQVFDELGGQTGLPSKEASEDVVARCAIIQFTKELLSIVKGKADRGYWPDYQPADHRDDVVAWIGKQQRTAQSLAAAFRRARIIPS